MSNLDVFEFVFKSMKDAFEGGKGKREKEKR